MSPIILLIGTGLLIVAAMRWREAVLTALFLAIFEGAIRKWVFPGSQEWVYFGKDILLVGAYIGYFATRHWSRPVRLPHHPANLTLAFLAIACVVQAVNPMITSPGVALFGIRAYLIYIPLMYLVPALFPNATALRRFGRVFLVVALVPLVVGCVQFASPVDSVVNRYAWSSEDITAFGEGFGRPRITGTFPYIAGHTTFLTVMLLMCLPFAVYAQSGKTRLSVLVILSLTLSNIFMTGSRTPMVISIAGLLVLAAMSVRISWAELPRTILALALAAGVMLWIAVSVFPEAYNAFVLRTAGTEEDMAGRAVSPMRNVVSSVEKSGLNGYGVGSANQAAIIIQPEGRRSMPGAENETERIIIELGPIGFLLVMMGRLQISAALWSALGQAHGAERRAFLTGAFLVSLAYLLGNLVFNSTASIAYWFLAGFALLPAWNEENEHANAHPERTGPRAAPVGSPAGNGIAG